MVELICSCGHLDKEHKWPDLHFYGDTQCRICPCMKFMLDNLLYLEELDKEYYLGR
jgi:hypothetical protein